MNQQLQEKMFEINYLYGNEKTKYDVFRRVAKAISLGDGEFEQRLYQYLVNEYFCFATPILANIGTDRGLPISCFVNEVEDSRKGIFDVYQENAWLGSDGGGIGTDWSKVRAVGESISNKGSSSGIIPFIKVSDSYSLAVSQGGLRRASQAVYLDVSHPEIVEFIDIRKDDGADKNRRSLNVHHGVKLSNAFMQAVKNDKSWDLISPKTGEVVKTIDAFSLFVKILTTRMERGEPFIFFTDNVNAHKPEAYVREGKEIKLSNLCTEILQYTDAETTAVCCLGSINLVNWDVVKDNPNFFMDITKALDNVLEIFINTADPIIYKKAIKSVKTERNIGIGVMGYHSLLQMQKIPYESSRAISLNRSIFQTISQKVKEASIALNAPSLTPKNTLRLAIAPTSSISILCGGVSAGIEPLISNIYTHKVGVGSFICKNPILEKYIAENGSPSDWDIIIRDGGSVANIAWMPQEIKDVFKTAYELDQAWVLEHAKYRQEFICQGQSTNLFLRHDVSKRELFNLHVKAWESGLKTLYYLRSDSPLKVNLGKAIEREIIPECLSCQ